MKDFKLLLIVVLVITLYSAPLFSQGVDNAINPEKLNRKVDEWVKGQVTFNDGKTIQCQFSYNPLVPEGLLKIKDGDKIITGTVFNIESFTFYDKNTSTEHRYFSFPIDNNNRVFIELLYEDSFYSILGRKSVKIIKYAGSNNYSASDVRTHYQRYLVDIDTGQIYNLTPITLLAIMGDRKKEVKKFIKANKLKFERTDDYILVIKKYEDLTK